MLLNFENGIGEWSRCRVLQNFGKGTGKCAKDWVKATKFWKKDQEMCKTLGKRYKILEKAPLNVQKAG